MTFKLSEKFSSKYKGKQPKWGYGDLSYFTYKRTYSRLTSEGVQEEFFDTLKRVTEGTFSIQEKHCKTNGLPWNAYQAQKTAQTFFEKMWNFKFLPPGRGLWMMGTEIVDKIGSAGLNNCFSGETEFLTDSGVKTFIEAVGTKQKVLSSEGKWVEAEVKEFGQQKLYRLTLSRQGVKKDIFVTGDHIWFSRDRRKPYRSSGWNEFKTTDLRPGIHRLQYSFGQGVKNIDPSPFGISHGFVFGDGCRRGDNRNSAVANLIGEKDSALEKYFELCPSRQLEHADGKEYYCIPNFFKDKPSISENKTYLFGWLAGYFAADGSCKKDGTAKISSSSHDNILFVRDVCSVLGIGAYSIQEEDRISNLTNKPHKMYHITLMRQHLSEKFFLIDEHRKNFVDAGGSDIKSRHWIVESVEETDRFETVYCVQVPDRNCFTLSDNILTHNCGFVSTKDISIDLAAPFAWAMDMLMLGVGIGFDTKGAKSITVKKPKDNIVNFEIPDSREGWVDSIKLLLNSYQGKDSVTFSYDLIRPYGAPIKGFGGQSSGPDPLEDLHNNIRDILDGLIGEKISSVAIVDIMNFVGKCVVAGNVRRSAELGIGEIDDREYVEMKDPTKFGEELGDRRWASNNSVFASSNSDFGLVTNNIISNGEPGLIFLDNARHYGRMKDGWVSFESERYDDVDGFNPCVTSDSWINTSIGPKQVSDLVGKEFLAKVNGKNYKTLSSGFWKTGNKKVFTLITKEGYEVCLTKEHKVLTDDGVWVEAQDLKSNDKVVIHNHRESSDWGTKNDEDQGSGYLMGLLVGDGTFVKGRPVLSVWSKGNPGFGGILEAVEKASEKLGRRKDFNGWGYIEDREEYRYSLSSIGEISKKYNLNKNKVISKEIEGSSSSFYKGFLSGLFDADGSVQGAQEKGVSIRLNQSDLNRLKTVQRMLLRLGIFSSIYKRRDEGYRSMPDGKENFDLIISGQDIVEYSEKIGFSDFHKSKLLESKIKNYKRKPNETKFIGTFVELVEGDYEDVYDVTVDEVHAFDANGIYVHNCVEQNLENHELCCLVETLPANHDSPEEYIETLKYAYLYAKSVTLVPTHNEKTNAVMMRNRRIGCSMSGIQQAFKKFGHSSFLNDFCDKGYEAIRGWDRVYSRWLGIPRSIKMTTVKPSGCQRKDTLISTSNGLLSLDEIGDTLGSEWQDHKMDVMSDKDSFEQSTKFYVNGFVKTKKITTSDGVELESSHNHMYRILDSESNYIWKRADEMSVGDNLVVKLGTQFTENVPSLLSLDESEIACNAKEIRTPDKMSEDLAWFLGLVYGDGSIHNKGVRISFNRKQPALLDWVIEYVKKEFDIDSYIDDGNTLYINSTTLLSWMEKNSILKAFSSDIQVPRIIRESRKEIGIAFIDGFWRADGGMHNLSNWTMCSVSETFSRQILQLCRAVGFNVKIKSAGPGGLGSKDRWIVQNRDIAPNRYQSKDFKSRFWNDFWLDPIVSIEDSECETFDIEVPEGNTYIANGVVSHNTVSILAGATPGIHFTHDEFYYRTVRCSASSPLIKNLIEANYRIEFSATDSKILKKSIKEAGSEIGKEESENWKKYIDINSIKPIGVTSDSIFESFASKGGTVVVYFPVKEENFTKSKFDVSVWEQVLAVREMQHYWSDNGVSCTVTFNKDEAKDLKRVIEFVSPYVKSLSFLPLTDHKYEQAPYQEISEEDYDKYSKQIKPVDFGKSEEADISGSKFCDGDQCEWSPSDDIE